MPRETVEKTYILISARIDTKHGGHHSAYLVERFGESGVIARFTSIGLLPAHTDRHQASSYALSRGMEPDGKWSQTKSNRHKKLYLVKKEMRKDEW